MTAQGKAAPAKKEESSDDSDSDSDDSDSEDEEPAKPAAKAKAANGASKKVRNFPSSVETMQAPCCVRHAMSSLVMWPL